jgi:hypothetical protein
MSASCDVARKKNATVIVLAFMLGSTCYMLFGNVSQATPEPTSTSDAEQEDDKPLARLEVDDDGSVSGKVDLLKLTETLWQKMVG